MYNGLLSIAVDTLSSGNNLNYLKDRYATTELIGNPVPIWVDTTNKWVLYNEIPELRSVINRYANMVASAKPVVKDMEGNVISADDSTSQNDWLFRLLDEPNALQTWADAMKMLMINRCVTGNAVGYTPRGTLGNVQNLTPLAFNKVQIVSTGKTLNQTTLAGFIEEFKIPRNFTGQYDTYQPEEVIYFSDVDGINLYDAKSRIDTLKYPLSNIVATYKKRNALLVNLFALGALVAEPGNDGVSAIPIDPDDVKDMRDDLKKRHDNEVIVSDKSWRFEDMSYPVKDLMLFEEMTADKLELIDAYGLNQYMFTQNTTSRGSTFSNVEMGERQAYNSTIIPDTEILYKQLTKQLGLKEMGLELCPSFDHISVLKTDITKSAEAMFKRAQAVEKIATQIELDDDTKRVLLQID